MNMRCFSGMQFPGFPRYAINVLTGRVVRVAMDSCCENCVFRNQNVFACLELFPWWTMKSIVSSLITLVRAGTSERCHHICNRCYGVGLKAKFACAIDFSSSSSRRRRRLSHVWRSAAVRRYFFCFTELTPVFLHHTHSYNTTTAITRLLVIAWRIIIDRVSGICFVPQATKTTWSRLCLYYALFLKSRLDK